MFVCICRFDSSPRHLQPVSLCMASQKGVRFEVEDMSDRWTRGLVVSTGHSVNVKQEVYRFEAAMVFGDGIRDSWIVDGSWYRTRALR